MRTEHLSIIIAPLVRIDKSLGVVFLIEVESWQDRVFLKTRNRLIEAQRLRWSKISLGGASFLFVDELKEKTIFILTLFFLSSQRSFSRSLFSHWRTLYIYFERIYYQPLNKTLLAYLLSFFPKKVSFLNKTDLIMDSMINLST